MGSAIDVDGVRWAFEERGSGSAVLFFHGTLASRGQFAAQVEALAGHYRCVAFDWPGHGESGWDPDGWSVGDLVEGVPRLIDALGEERVTLVGLSQGGAIGMRVAIRFPERVRALVTMSAGPDPLPAETADAMRRLGRHLAVADDDERRAALADLQRSVLHAPGWAQSHPEAAERELSVMLGHDRTALPLVTAIPSGYEDISDRLADIRCPTLIVWGEHDARASRGPQMAAAIPDSTLVEIEGAGHHVAVEAPEATTDAVERFLDGLDLETQSERSSL
jgi:pimeloyl-ACP methyl ester carboxylesterase